MESGEHFQLPWHIVVSADVNVLSPDPGYVFIPTAQLKGRLVVLALEPKSMLGLVTYEKYAHFLKKGQANP